MQGGTVGVAPTPLNIGPQQVATPVTAAPTPAIAGAGGYGLTALESLEHLDIRYCYWARNDLFCKLTNLKTLCIGGCEGLTWGFLKNIQEETRVERFTKWESRADLYELVKQIRAEEHWPVRC